jgi:hypothetical protein
VTTVVMIEYRLPTEAVSDFAEWKRVFDTDPVGRKAHGAVRHAIYQGHGDGNHFILTMEFGTVAEAQSFLNNPMLKQSWDISGAGRSWLLEEAESITY